MMIDKDICIVLVLRAFTMLMD